MADGFVHTIRREDGWINTVEGVDETPLLEGVFETKEEAAVAGQMEARRRLTEHVIHNEDGSIGQRNSYGGDPAHRPG